MTTDNFTKAAQAEAEAWWPGSAGPTIIALGVHTAEWARDYLTEQMKQKVAAAHQERNKALERARKAEELLRNVGEYLSEQEPTLAESEAARKEFFKVVGWSPDDEWMIRILRAARDARQDQEKQ